MVEGDLRQTDFVARLVDETERCFGGPDIVTAIAGVNMNKAVIDTIEDDYERVFSINRRAMFWIFYEAARRVRNDGRILGVSSNIVLQARAGFALCEASKAAVE